ncbi:MAG: sulfatase-like hydrolase/transferase [Cyclobacteriaceae bacterium]
MLVFFARFWRFLPLLGMLLLVGSCLENKKTEKPNVIIIYTDDQRAETLSSYNPEGPIQTPHIDRLAENGIRFTNGFVPSPICGVSRACLISGQYMSNHEVKRFQKALPEQSFQQSYPVQLKQAGYYLGLFGKHGFGITQNQKAVFDQYDATTGQGPAFQNYKGKRMHDAEWLTLKTKEFLDSIPQGQPFCLQLNYKEPHPTAVPAPEDEGKLASYPFERQKTDNEEEHAKLPPFVQTGYGSKSYNTMFGTDERLQIYLSHYFEKVMSVDRSIGEITKMLEEKGLDQNTVVVFLSDHGTHFGEKQLGGKWSPYEQSLKIPFIIYDPRSSSRGMVSDQMVLNIDVAPTLLEMAGMSVPETMDGKSLIPLIQGDDVVDFRNHFFFEHFVSPTSPIYIPRHDGVRTKTGKYVRWIDLDPVEEEFYDLVNDQTESNNLIDDPQYQSVVAGVRDLHASFREKYPQDVDYRSYQKYGQSGAKTIDWEKFKEFRPEKYELIAAQVDSLSVSWEAAVSDWSVRYEICKNVGYWY